MNRFMNWIGSKNKRIENGVQFSLYNVNPHDLMHENNSLFFHITESNSCGLLNKSFVPSLWKILVDKSLFLEINQAGTSPNEFLGPKTHFSGLFSSLSSRDDFRGVVCNAIWLCQLLSFWRKFILSWKRYNPWTF